MDLKEYYLMHKNLPVCLMEISDDGSISRVRRNASAAEHFPLGGQMNEMKFHEWWRDRAIPKTIVIELPLRGDDHSNVSSSRAAVFHLP